MTGTTAENLDFDHLRSGNFERRATTKNNENQSGVIDFLSCISYTRTPTQIG